VEKIKLPDSSNNGYGVSGEILTSRGSNNTPHWVTPTAEETYTAGSNMSLTGTEFNIPQSVAITANPTFGTVSANLTGTATKATSLIDVGYNVYIHNAEGVPQLRSTAGNGYPNNVHSFYSDYTGAIWPSDDRIKWNETLLNEDRSTNIIKDMKFYQYDILKKPFLDSYDTYDPSKCRKGFGVIAQEVEALKVKYPELSDVVKNTGVNGDIKAVNYLNIFSIMGATIKSLIKRIEVLESK